MRLDIEIVSSFSEIDASDWNSLNRDDFVFADHRFLSAMEDSGSLGRRTGWYPRLVLARDEVGRLLGALPLFAKTNSYGEYIFDWSWANAAHLAGDDYYPKLVAAIPFTPASGPKFLIHPDLPSELDPTDIRATLLTGAEEVLKLMEAKSLHFLFITREEAEELADDEFAIRHSYQYHWRNTGDWTTFEGFLDSLRSKRRSEIRRERSGAQGHGLKIERLTGDQLTPEHARIMTRLYQSTTGKMGGSAYLTPRFFELIFERLKEQILFIVASDEQGPCAGTLNFFSGKTLFGRYWGALRDYKHLHFELCYYQTIEWALQHGLEKFEAGAQGEHKFNRGFLPSLTLSAHQLQNPDLSRAVRAFIEEEKASIAELFRDYKAHDPFQGQRA